MASHLMKSSVCMPRNCMFHPLRPSTATHRLSSLANQKCESRRNVCTYAKAKGGAKGGSSNDKGGAKGGASAGDDFVAISKATTADTDDRMKKCLAAVADNFNTVRTGRANPAILDKIRVEQYGALVPIKQIAAVTIPEATILMITPYDKSDLKAIERAIMESDIGLNPNNDGEKIRLALPALTEERRKELTKSVSKMGEDGKVALRNVRKDAMKKVEKVDFPKDQKKSMEDGIQKLTESYVKKVDDMVKAKNDDLLKM